MKTKFKIGDKVKVVLDDTGRNRCVGEIGKIVEIEEGSPYPYALDCSPTTCFASHELILVKGGKVVPEDLTRYMVYGQGCNNKSELFQTEKELKQELKSVVNNRDWTGRLLGYKLVPIFEAEKKTVLKVFKKTIVKKVKKKKK